MKIKEMISQHRRDFYATYECESCGYITEKKSGYDDRNFHDNVIPNMKCDKCGKSRNDLGLLGESTPTKYESWQTV
jgi:C4-type Zn-finger protein